jgi:two-component system response regulator FixJ
VQDSEQAVVAVVDDEPAVRSSLARLLRSADYRPATYESGQEFLDSLRSAPPDCAILDLHMPGLTGMEVLTHLAQRESPVPVIVLTSYSSAEARQRALEQGVTVFLEKPVERSVLLAAIRDAIARRDSSTHLELEHGTRPAEGSSQ